MRVASPPAALPGDDAERAVAAALAPGAAPEAVTDAARVLIALGERAYAGERAAYARYQALVHDLQIPRDPATYAVRRFLARMLDPLEESVIPPCEPGPLLSGADFVARVREELDRSSGLAHPLSRFLFGGEATLEDLRIYLSHQWVRSRGFHRELNELALSLPLSRAALLYRNLHEETGAAPGELSHPALLARLLQHLGLPAREDDRPALPEAQAYLNNRVRCARHPEPAWGLAVLFALEHGTPATHGALYDLLRRLGVPEEHCTFHRTHITADVAHAEDLARLTAELVDTPAAQATYLRSLRRHRALHRAYFDRIWGELQDRRTR